MKFDHRACLVALVITSSVGAAACGGRSPNEPPAASERTATLATTTPGPAAPARMPIPGAPDDETGRVFNQRILHTIEIEVAQEDVSRLVPGNDERVRARLTFDGTRVDDVGLRLKGGLASEQPLTGKPGFSIDTDRFVSKRNLFGVTRFTLGNSIQDPSFVTESISYAVFREAGVIAPRTALVNVSFNGELFGLYVIREGYDKNFLRRTFADPNGNFYEGALRVDISDVAHMEARTNEDVNDKSDLAALARVVEESPDETFLADISEHVDLEELLTYWAVESVIHHWDGYIRPNNYYVYHDPSIDKFVFLAYGADWAMLDPSYSIFAEPGPTGEMALRLYASAEFRQRLKSRVLEVLDQHWDADSLLSQAGELAAQVRATGLSGSRESTTLAGFEQEFAARLAFITSRAGIVRAQLGAP